MSVRVLSDLQIHPFTYFKFSQGAVLADIMKNKEDFWMSKAEYEEKGLRCLEKLGVAPK